jgi:V/A-type H+-transporting ATPase subunit I
MNIPRHLRDKPFKDALVELQRDLGELRKKEKKLKEQSDRFFSENGAELIALQRVCRDRFSRIEALTRFACTRYTFIVRGWLPSRSLKPLTKRLAEESGNAAVLSELKSRAPDEPPPVQLANPRPASYFEPLVKLIGLPRYGTVDPTLLVAGFFPPMFGLMLGDMGYGAIFAIGAIVLLILSKGRKLMRSIGIVAAASAFFTIVFGALFGEFFGTFGHILGIEPLWRERFVATGPGKAEAVLGYLALTVGIGVFHVLLGLILGIVNYRRVGDRGQLLGNISKILGIIVLFFFLGRMVQILPPVFTTLGVVALLVFLVLMVVQIIHQPVHGALLPLEVINTIGNILSYVRIMAIGMASVVLALLATLFGGMIENVVLAAVVVILIHSLNLALGIIDPTIQGLRLQYVEFFSKFFLGGGVPYSPFRRRGGI